MSAMILREEPTKYQTVQRDTFYRMSVGRYHELIRSGVFDESDEIELLQGFLVNKMPINPSHSFATDEVRDQLTAVLERGYFAKSQAPITLSDSEPEPDVFVVRGEKRDFVARHPQAEDVPLVIEVSNSTLERDQGWKKEIYAAAGIPVYWIVNLVDEQIEVFSDAGTADYLTKRTFQRGDHLPVVVDDETITTLEVSTLLP